MHLDLLRPQQAKRPSQAAGHAWYSPYDDCQARTQQGLSAFMISCCGCKSNAILSCSPGKMPTSSAQSISCGPLLLGIPGIWSRRRLGVNCHSSPPLPVTIMPFPAHGKEPGGKDKCFWTNLSLRSSMTLPALKGHNVLPENYE